MMALDDLLDALPPSELPAQQAYQTLLNQVPAAVLVRDDFGRLRFVNQQAEALFGYTQAELLGAPIDVLIPERFRSRHRASRLAHREQTAVRTAGPDVAVPGLRKDGTEFPVDISLSPITLGGQRFVIDVVRDATAQQQGVQQRASLMRSLIRDLDRPLALVRGTLHLLQQATARGDMPSVEELREELAILAASADHVGAAVTELVDVAQGAAGQRTALVYHPMDLVALVREAVWVHQQIAPQRIAFQTQEAVLRIEADRDRLSRVVANLIANARAYSPENSEIRINLTEQEDGRRSWAVLTMTDQGIGIPARDLPHIFEQFYRGTNVPATTPGNGMGLCTANRTVEQQGGEIHIDSIEGEGTTVTVRLPMDSSRSLPLVRGRLATAGHASRHIRPARRAL